MEIKHVEIVCTHVIRYACGCTTTRIEACRGLQQAHPLCASHDAHVIQEETITDFNGPLDETLYHEEVEETGDNKGKSRYCAI